MMNQPSRLEFGSIVGERYRIIRTLGSGGMSRVFMAEDLKLPGKHWAVKESIADPKIMKIVRTEAEMLISLSHPRLPRIVDFFEYPPSGAVYLVMDYIEGITLEAYMRGYQGYIPQEQIIPLALQVLDVLDYLHTRQLPVIYRDLKPANIMLTPEMEFKLIDFGIARSYKSELDQDTIKLGTVGFAAPEQYGTGQTDARSDLYSLGALLLYLCTGGKYSEWTAGVEGYIRGELPRHLIPIIRKLLRDHPEERFQSAEEVIGELRRSADFQSAQPGKSMSNASMDYAGTRVVAVLGVSSGSGATHTAIAVSHYLARRTHSVALVELHSTAKAFARLQEVVEGIPVGQASSSRRFEVDGVHYWRQTSRADVISLLGGSYRFIVLDLGNGQDNERLEEFLRADYPLVVGSGAEWRVQDITGLARSLQRLPQHKWNYCLPLASSEAVRRLRKELEHDKVFALPFHSDPFEQDDEMDQVLDELFRGVITDTRKKRFGFLKRQH
ncbi:serine/threonine protein kinase [Paenibacillus sp. AK121]|uniref:serine/threonine protein kinase n=1 Tax=Paenibacillus sp. AK121 TaxID=2849670 RepID=UPI001C23D0EF|nr:serine/threonine-protein kinase [Paenibacillus sp. AK121]MBU9706548.1 serine/threonine protein kinase [Paenibacillus sp. AK121]